MSSWLTFVLIGIAAGIASGLFGVGGGVVVLPALIYWAGLTQHMATGTSLAVLLPPIGLGIRLVYGACKRLGWLQAGRAPASRGWAIQAGFSRRPRSRVLSAARRYGCHSIPILNTG